MSRLEWDKTGERLFETGVSRGVLYRQGAGGQYGAGEAWNGLTAVTESPSGAEANPQYADNIKYLNLFSAEEFGGTIEAFSSPESFDECDGTAVPVAGVSVGQQSRRPFGLSYQTRVGNDIDGTDFGYKIHLVYGAMASPSEKAYATINDSPEAMALSWEFTTTPVNAGNEFKPTASLTIDSTRVDSDALKSLEDLLYGTEGQDARLPLPAEVIGIFSGSAPVVVSPTEPVYDPGTHIINIPTVTGVEYRIHGEVVEDTYELEEDESVLVVARPLVGYKFPTVVDVDWLYTY